MRCFARAGVAKTSFEDVAREAGTSRATLYRSFPGGKDALVAAAVADEVSHQVAELVADLEAETELERTLVVALTSAWRRICGHDALQHLIVHEPEVVLPAVSFDAFERLLAEASRRFEPPLRRFLDEEAALRTGEWLTRLVVSYALTPSPHVDLADEQSTQRFVHTHLLPGLVPST